jgi:hypothetical protein
MRQFVTGIIAILTSCALAHGQDKASDHKSGTRGSQAASADGGTAKHGPRQTLEIDNDSVSVLRIRIGPREKIPMHEVTPRVAVWLTDAHLRLTNPDGTTKEEHIKAGQTGWVSGHRHAGENLGDQPIEFIVVVPKVGLRPAANRH